MAKDTGKQLSTARGGGGKRSKPKPKSVKAKVTNKMNSKRRLSRFGKVQKKGHRGIAASFVTRGKALKKLQLSLKDFRRLCILKGVYPRDPKKKSEGQDKTYYHIKDITYLAHEPILEKFRDMKTFLKKIRKSAGKKNFTEAQRKEKVKPEYSLDHIVVERYPNFRDALEDLDDALCMIHLFACLPAEAAIDAKWTQRAQTLAREWSYIVARNHSLKKVFVSIKGIYYQAEVQGVEINWLQPHQFTQNLPSDVDYRVMLTFLEFYDTLLKFVNFKLFHQQGLAYPPKLNPNKNKKGSGLMALVLQPLKKQKAIEATAAEEEEEWDKVEEEEGEEEIDQEEADDEGEDSNENSNSSDSLVPATAVTSSADLKQVQQEIKAIASQARNKQVVVRAKDEDDDEGEGGAENAPLQIEAAFAEDESAQQLQEEQSEDATLHASQRIFKGLHFFLQREVPLRTLELVIRSFAGKVNWEGDGSGIKANDERITHQIMDRPTQGHRYFTCEYVQPQWVFDCANNKVLLPVLRYAPGEALPPHLSPFVDDEREGYVPEYRTELARYTSAAQARKEGKYVHESEDEGDDEEGDAEELGAEEAHARELEAELQGVDPHAVRGGGDNDASEDDDEDEGGEQEEEQEEEEVQAPKKNKRQRQEEEEHEMRVNMMSKKAKRLYGRMQHGIQQKQNSVASLEAKRKALKKQKTQ